LGTGPIWTRDFIGYAQEASRFTIFYQAVPQLSTVKGDAAGTAI
jgi:hypothetical protein